MLRTLQLCCLSFFVVILAPRDVSCFGINLIKVAEDDRSQVFCTIALLRKYFHSGETLSGSLISMSITSASSRVQQNVLKAIHQDAEAWSVVVKNARQPMPSLTPDQILHEKPQCYFLILENLEDEDLEDIFEEWKTNVNWNPLAQFVVYLASVEETDDEMTELMVEIMLNFMNKKIYNVNVIGQNEENGFYYGKTVFPYHPDNNCGNRVITIETLDICDYQESEKDDEDDNYDEDNYVDETQVWKGDEGTEYGDNDIGDYGEQNAKDNEEIDVGENIGEIDKQDEPNYGESSAGNDVGENSSNGEGNSHISGATDDESNSKKGGGDVIVEKDESNLHDGASNPDYNSQEELENNGDTNVEKDPSTSESSINAFNTDTENDLDYTKNEIKFNDDIVDVENDELGIQLRNLKKFEKLLDNSNNLSAENDHQNSSTAKFYLEELYPALFLDKFPKDLSGCPLIAAYRPWQPYIFNEVSEEAEYDNEATNEEESVGGEVNEGGEYEESITNTSMGEASYEGDGGNVGEGEEGEEEDEYGSEEDGESKTKLSGIEYKMVETIGERLHISINLQVENNNLYHLFQLLIDGDIEMVVGGIDEDPSISQFVSSTIPYHQDDLTWCVAKAKRKHNLFNFLACFRLGVWVLTLAFILVTALKVIITRKLLRVRFWDMQGYFTVGIRILGVTLSQSTPLKSLPTALNVTLGAAFFMGFMFSNVYQSFLVSTLTNPKSSSQISHLEEIYRHRMTIMGSVESVRHLNKDGEIFKYIREKFQMCYNIEECLNRAAADETVAVAVSRQHSFYNPRIPRDRLYCFDRDENVYVYLVTMLMPKKFHLLHKINPVIQHIIESGHMQKWARDLNMKREIQERIHRAQEDTFQSLNMPQVMGAFVFSGFLMLFALWVFALELWTYWMVVKQRTRLKFVKALHRKFKPP